MLDDNTGSHMFPILWQFNYVGIHTVYTKICRFCERSVFTDSNKIRLIVLCWSAGFVLEFDWLKEVTVLGLHP